MNIKENIIKYSVRASVYYAKKKNMNGETNNQINLKKEKDIRVICSEHNYFAWDRFSLQSSLAKPNSDSATTKQSINDSSFLTSWFSFTHSPPNRIINFRFRHPPPIPPATCHSSISLPSGACDHRLSQLSNPHPPSSSPTLQPSFPLRNNFLVAPKYYTTLPLSISLSLSLPHSRTHTDTQHWNWDCSIFMEMAHVKTRARTALGVGASATSPKRKKIAINNSNNISPSSFVQLKSLSNTAASETEERCSGDSPASCCSSNGSFDGNRIIKFSDLEVIIVNYYQRIT